ncbi:MAG: glycosyltransferase [Synechococcales cyanobacterium M58_A2018_015]|nr:glycosyltransferase [Synechococcales cyanobacterium M58_A2018_015]
MNKTTHREQALHVLMMPDYRADNPYQSLLTQALEQENVAVAFPNGYRRVFPIFRAMKDCQHSIDVLHLHWLGPYIKGDRWPIKFFYSIKFLIDIWLIRLSGIRVVWTVHNYISHDSRFPRLEIGLRRILCRLVDRVIVHNYSSLKDICQLYQLSEAKAAVIPIGTYRHVYASPIDNLTARKQLQLPLSGRIFLHQGFLRPYKGVEALLQVWADHHTAFAGDTLLIAGKPFDEAYRQQLIQLAADVKGVMLHLEFIEDDQLHLFFSAATVVVLPFTQILTSSSLLLAMSYSKPVIAPKLGGIAETLATANDLLYDPKDENGLLNSLKASKQIDLEELSQRVKAACDQLNWEAIGQKTQQLYQLALHSVD